MYQRSTPLMKECAHSGSRPVNKAANQPITATTISATKRNHSTMMCGMARMKRKPTVSRPWGSVPS